MGRLALAATAAGVAVGLWVLLRELGRAAPPDPAPSDQAADSALDATQAPTATAKTSAAQAPKSAPSPHSEKEEAPAVASTVRPGSKAPLEKPLSGGVPEPPVAKSDPPLSVLMQPLAAREQPSSEQHSLTAMMAQQAMQQTQALQQQQQPHASEPHAKEREPHKKQTKKDSKPPKPKSPPEPPSAPAAEGEPEASAAGPMIDCVVQRAVLAQPAELVAVARPGPDKDETKGKNNKKKGGGKDKSKASTSWNEAFAQAIQVLDSGMPDAAKQAHVALDAALATAGKTGAPRDAVSITLRGIGFAHASCASLDEAAASYARALAEARRRSPDSPVLLGCWRDMAIVRRERAEHAEAEACWNEAAVAMQSMQTAAGRAIKGGPTSSTLLWNMVARVDLQLARADCLRDQCRFDEAEGLIEKALKWRERNMGADEPATLAAVYDLSSCIRTRYVAAAAAPTLAAGGLCLGCTDGGEDGTGGGGSAGGASADGDAAAAANATLASPKGSDSEAAGVRERRLAALDEMSGAASSLDTRWKAGLRGLVAGEPSTRFAEHATMLASVAQLHKNHVEAVYLFRLVIEEYERLEGGELHTLPATNGASSAQANGGGTLAASLGGSTVGSSGQEETGSGLSEVERAELYNSLGESLLEVRHYAAAGPIFAKARAALEAAEGVEPSSIASVEANEARLLSERGELEEATKVFEKAMATTSKATGEALVKAANATDLSQVVMVHVLHARVLQLYGAHCAKHGRAEEAGRMAAAVRELELRYSFSSA